MPTPSRDGTNENEDDGDDGNGDGLEDCRPCRGRAVDEVDPARGIGARSCARGSCVYAGAVVILEHSVFSFRFLSATHCRATGHNCIISGEGSQVGWLFLFADTRRLGF